MNRNSQQTGDKTEQPQPFAALTIALPKGGDTRSEGKFAAHPMIGAGSLSARTRIHPTPGVVTDGYGRGKP